VQLGVFGGSFDPPHIGHLLMAQDAVETLGLDRVLFVPAGAQPLKGALFAPPRDRLAMVRLLVGDDPRMTVDPIEIERPGLSFTVDTLRGLHARYPEAEFTLLLGADAAALLPQWREPATVLQLARLVVFSRDGRTPAPLPAWLAAAASAGAGEPLLLPARRVDVSSTEIRARVAQGRPVRGMVPDSVAAYIAAHGLYLERDRTGG
jgi:nicotinate-nucleotide adenylyltransferase